MESSVSNILGIDVDIKDVKNPFELYRKMRPYYFSDSYVIREMTPDMFAFYMSQLSTDMKQDLFEDMTRQIVCKLITPNLIPRTGPTGGGDGKTDIETHPVNAQIYEKWYYADACKGNEKWAFAISCKTDWKQKIDSDVKNIVSTDRNFNKIFFCTNQPVPSKNKSELYSKYKSTYQIEVTILDINWYKQAVFENGCYNIAIKSLNLSAQFIEKVEEGPGDKEKKRELKEVESRIESVNLDCALNTPYVEDLLRAAILSRELENPKIITSGRFALALEQARNLGTTQQIFNIVYQIAWTEFYWNEDADAMFVKYQELKEMLNQEVNAIRIEKLYNLRYLTTIAIDCKLFKITPNTAREDEYWNHLYDTLSEDQEHQSSFLYLKICMLETTLLEHIRSSKDIDDVLIQLKDSIQESTRHLDIPFDAHSVILNQVGALVGNNTVYEEIVDLIADICRKMKSEITSAEIHYDRGVQSLDQKEYQLAIKHFGKCIIAYQKEATKNNLVKASAMLAISYNGLDLTYSAKILFVKALSLLLHKTETEGPIDHLIITVLFELCRLELKVGQLNSFFNWLYMLDMIVAVHPSFQDDSFNRQKLELDSILATILLSSTPNNESWSVIPSICDDFGLCVSKDAILYTLKYEEELSQEFKDIVMAEDNWKERIAQLSKSGVSIFPLYVSSQGKSKLDTLVKGCHIKATCRSDMRIQAYAEIYLAFLETYMATMTISDMAISSPEINLEIKVNTSGKTELKKGDKTNEYIIKINQKTVTDKEVWNTCAHLIANFLSQNSMSKDLDYSFIKKFQDDNIGERLAVLGNHYKELKQSYLHDYKCSLELWWNKTKKKYPIKGVYQNDDSIFQAKGKQATQIITDLIDYSLWDNAKWSGCGYMMAYDGTEPAILILLYKEFRYAKKIFEKWEEDYRNNRLNLKLTFITGIDANNPKWYKVIIAPDLKRVFDKAQSQESRYVVTSSRFHLMQSTDDTNLNMFKELYSKFHYAGITATEIENNQMSFDSNKRYPHVIPVTNIDFRDAWTIGENDPDSMAILPEDRPIIPKGKENDAPVIKLIESKKQMYGKS